MKIHNSLVVTILIITIFITFNHSQGKQTEGPLSGRFRIHKWLTLETEPIDAKLQLTPPLLIAGVLCFLSAAISSAGGIGGGGLIIPILIFVVGFDLKTASTFTAFMVTGVSLASIFCSIFDATPRYEGKTLIDFDIALLSQPCVLLGVSVGVICNLVLPVWLITVLFAIFLAWCSFRTCKSGLRIWVWESEARSDVVVMNERKQPLLDGAGKDKFGYPWMKLGILILVWLSFFVLYLVRESEYGQSVLHIEPCGVGYWLLSSVQIPLTIIFTAWILYSRKESHKDQDPSRQEIEGSRDRPSSLMFPVMALLMGILCGVFGIGGGMLISPLLLQVGIAPEVTAATCSFMVLFSASMSAMQFLLLGMEHVGDALIFTIICFVGSVIGKMVVQKAIRKYGRASLIVFSVVTVMVLSTVMMTSYGALNVWNDYKSGEYMGFKLPCRIRLR